MTKDITSENLKVMSKARIITGNVCSENKNIASHETVAAVHTHTHTHTHYVY